MAFVDTGFLLRAPSKGMKIQFCYFTLPVDLPFNGRNLSLHESKESI
jgi:hypothetical protein